MTEFSSNIFITTLKTLCPVMFSFPPFQYISWQLKLAYHPLSFDSSLTQFRLPSGENTKAKPALGICLLLCVSAQMMIPLERVWGIMFLCYGVACTPAGSVHALFCGFLVCQTRWESNSCYCFVIQYTNLFLFPQNVGRNVCATKCILQKLGSY